MPKHSPFNPRTRLATYQGKPRYIIRGERKIDLTGIAGLGGRAGRAFNLPDTHDAIQWRIEDQTWCVDNGFFFERCLMCDERVSIVPMPWRSRETADQILTTIEQRVFRRDRRAERAWAFIRQQDAFGYTGAWDTRVMYLPTRGTSIGWYVDVYAEERQARLRDALDPGGETQTGDDVRVMIAQAHQEVRADWITWATSVAPDSARRRAERTGIPITDFNPSWKPRLDGVYTPEQGRGRGRPKGSRNKRFQEQI